LAFCYHSSLDHNSSWFVSPVSFLPFESWHQSCRMVLTFQDNCLTSHQSLLHISLVSIIQILYFIVRADMLYFFFLPSLLYTYLSQTMASYNSNPFRDTPRDFGRSISCIRAQCYFCPCLWFSSTSKQKSACTHAWRTFESHNISRKGSISERQLHMCAVHVKLMINDRKISSKDPIQSIQGAHANDSQIVA